MSTVDLQSSISVTTGDRGVELVAQFLFSHVQHAVYLAAILPLCYVLASLDVDLLIFNLLHNTTDYRYCHDRRSQLRLVVRASPTLLCQCQIKTPIELIQLCFSYLYSTLIQISAAELVEALSHHSSSKASSPLIASFGGRLVDIEINNSFPFG